MKKLLLALLIIPFLSFSQTQNKIDSLVQVTKLSENKLEIVKANRMLASIYWNKRELDKALRCALESEKISKENNFYKEQVAALQTLGQTYHALTDYRKAISCYKEGISLLKLIPDKKLVPIGYIGFCNDLGLTMNGLQKRDSALYYYNEGVNKIDELDSVKLYRDEQMTKVDLKGMFYLNIANIYSEMGDSIKLKQYQNLISKLPNGKGNNIEKKLSDFLSIGKEVNAFMEKKNYDKAIEKTKQVMLMFKDEENPEFIIQPYTWLVDIYSKKGDYKNAYEYLSKLKSINDSLISKEKIKSISEIQGKYEIEKREKQIKILEQDNKLKELEMQKATLSRNILIGGLMFVLVLSCLLAMYFVRKQKTEKLIANAKINTLLKEQELKSVSDMLEVQESERKRIASDLHDRLGSMLSTVKLYFGSVEEQIEKMKEQNKEHYNKANLLLDEACEEVRKISHDLISGELLKFGLLPALTQLCKTIEGANKLKINLLFFGMDNRLDNSVEIPVYIIIQELINNILKHSKATDVTIQLNKTENNLNVVVEDNGIGFDIASVKNGMGLKNIETRVNKFNGKLYVDSGKDKGTTTIIDITF